jgi:hypothetical protein
MPAARTAATAALAVLLLLAAVGGGGPYFLAPPPVTRRAAPFRLPRAAGCGAALNAGAWTRRPVTASGPACAARYASCGADAARRWEFGAEARACGARRRAAAEARAALAGRRLACVGDSVARLLCAAVLAAAGAPPEALVFERHADFERRLEGNGNGEGDAVVAFYWRPFPANATALLREWAGAAGGAAAGAAARPDLVLVSAALWHMLHARDAAAFGAAVSELAGAAAALAAATPASAPAPALVLASVTETHPARMAAAAKVAAMTPAAVDAYNAALAGAGALAPGGPLALLDASALTHGCGEECSADGVHAEAAVFAAAAQVLLAQAACARERGAARCWAEGPE